MTRCVVTRPPGKAVRLTIQGHAGYAPPGCADLVCAGVSTLACTLMEALREEESKGGMRTLRIRSSFGDVRIEAEPAAWAKERVDAIFDTCLLGMRLLCEEYPAHVQVEPG